ncbi:MAG: tyrosine-type recombinase/integrase [Hyphomonadaceae bacterium]
MRDYHYFGFYGGAPRINVDPETGAYIEPYSPEYWARYAEVQKRPGPDPRFVSGMIAEFRRTVVARMSGGHKANTESNLDMIEARWATLPIEGLNARRFRRDVIAWRDSMAATPRAADYAVTTLNTFLNWLLDRAEIDINRAAGVAKIHHADRANITVSEAELAQQRAAVTPEAADVFLTLARTALRRSDVAKTLTLQTYYRDQKCLRLIPSKSIRPTRPKGRLVVIPLADEMCVLFDRLIEARKDRKVVAPQLLLTRSGRPWSPGAVTKAWNRARHGVVADEAKRIKAKPGTGVKARLHDLRGKGVSYLYELGVTVEDLVAITGWSLDDVWQMIKTYVGDEAMVGRVLAAVRRKNAALKPSLKLVTDAGADDDQNP